MINYCELERITEEMEVASFKELHQNSPRERERERHHDKLKLRWPRLKPRTSRLQ